MKETVNLNSNAIQVTTPTKQKEIGFYNLPTSTGSNLIYDVLEAGENIADLPNRKKRINNNTTYKVQQSGKKRLISLANQNGTGEVTAELADIEKATGSNISAKMLFTLSMIKANEQAIFNGELTKDYISFPLQELVDIGLYKTIRSARTGFNNGADLLTSIKIKGKIKKSKKAEVEIETLEVLFTGARIQKGQCYIFLNHRIKWSFFTQYFTILPRYYFSLSNRASDLLLYIFYLARQSVKAIEERANQNGGKGYFTISFRALQQKLQLPSEKGLNNPRRDIKDAIENAISEIEEAHIETYGSGGFYLEPTYNDKAPISEYLDNGYLKVILEGAFSSMFIAISKETEKQIKKYQARQEKIQDNAITQAIAKKKEKEMEAEAKSKALLPAPQEA